MAKRLRFIAVPLKRMTDAACSQAAAVSVEAGAVFQPDAWHHGKCTKPALGHRPSSVGTTALHLDPRSTEVQFLKRR